MKIKRLIIATLFGFFFGFVCWAFAFSNSGELPWIISLQIITGRALIGVAIGISSLEKIHWSLHGIIIGLIFSLPLAISGFMAPENPDFSHEKMFAGTLVMGIIYGFLIELITSVLFKAKIKN